jgi:hypothetical protein
MVISSTGKKWRDLNLTNKYMIHHSSVKRQVTGWTTGVRFSAGAEVFKNTSASRPAVGLIQWAEGGSFTGGKGGRDVKLIAQPNPVPRLRMRGVIPPLPTGVHLHGMVLDKAQRELHRLLYT